MSDPASFQQLVGRASPALLGLLLRFTRNRDTAEELLQDVWLRAWRERASIDPRRDPMPYLRTLTINRAIDWVRSVKSRPEETFIIDPAARAGAEEKLDISLSSLNERERAAILLYYQESKSVAEIAELLQTESATVKTWLHRARQKLKSQFEREGIRK